MTNVKYDNFNTLLYDKGNTNGYQYITQVTQPRFF